MSDSRTNEARMAAAQHLVKILAEENAALKRIDFVAAVALVPAKEAALAELTAPPSPTSFGAFAQRLGELAAENQVLLERAIAVQTRVVRIVARACVPPPAATRYNGHDSSAPSRRTAALALSTRA